MKLHLRGQYGYISKEEHTKKLSFVSKEINELSKDEHKTVEANNP